MHFSIFWQLGYFASFQAIYNFFEILLSEVCTKSYAPSKSRESQLMQFRDSLLGVRKQKSIWMWPPWRGVEYIIKGKVVASPDSRLWWVLCVRVACGSS
jgi:hypothetical protein